MNKKKIAILLAAVIVLIAGAIALTAQQRSDISGVITSAERPAIAVVDMRGTGDAQKYMDTFNTTLWDELANAGVLKMVAKSLYPLDVPQRPQDFKPPSAPLAARRGQAPSQPVRNGPWLTDWSGPPVSANYLAFGYTGVQDGRLVLYGWLFNTGQPDVNSAQVIGKLYSARLMPTARKKWRATSPPIFCSSSAPRAWRERRFILSPTAPARRKSGRWITTAPTSGR